MKLIVLTDAQVSELKAMWADESNRVEDIAANFGMSITPMRRLAKLHGLELRGAGGWTDERARAVADRYRAGESPTALGRELGLTRNQITSKLDRMGVLVRRQNIVRVAPKPRTPKAPAVKRVANPLGKDAKAKAAPRNRNGSAVDIPPTTPKAPYFSTLSEEPGSATIITLRPGQCKWPIGDPREETFTLCGKAAGGSYCDHHTTIAYRAVSPVEKSEYRRARRLA